MTEGNIAVLGGLTHTVTGDTLTDNRQTAVHAAQLHHRQLTDESTTTPPTPKENSEVTSSVDGS